MRIKEDYDGAEPSGNSIAVRNLLRLAHAFGNEDYQQSAEKSLRAFAGKMADQPTTMPQMLVALMHHTAAPQQIVLAGENIENFVAVLRPRFLPNHMVLKAGDVPAAQNMPPVAGKAAAYICENFACQMPTTDPAELVAVS
jgi:uncharacterized protein YyaL (SSP411 family)